MKRWSKVAGLLALSLSLGASVPSAFGEQSSSAYQGTGELGLTRIAGYSTGAALAKSGAEIVHYDKTTQKVYLINGDTKSFEIVDLSKLKSGIADQTLTVGSEAKFEIASLSPAGAPGLFGDVTSIVVHPTEDLIAVAVPNSIKTEPGSLVFFTKEGKYLSYVRVGALPDMVTVTPDGSKFLVANEGEPSESDYTMDPDGSVSIVSITKKLDGSFAFAAKTAGFDDPGVTIDGNVRYGSLKTGHVPNPTPSQWAADLEPEFITVSTDGTKAYVALQENNAIAVLDLQTDALTHVYGLGYKNYLLPGNKLDASDKDKKINIANYPVLGAYMPDGISLSTINGKTYLFTANEGDGREWGVKPNVGLDEVRFKDLYSTSGPKAQAKVRLNADYYPGISQSTLDAIDLSSLSQDDQLGRLKLMNTVSNVVYKDTVTGVTYYDALVTYGARSFSIWDVDKLGTGGQQVYDSGDDFEQIIAAKLPSLFNSGHEKNEFDSRSAAKGPEPEYIVTGEIGGQTYAFVGLERQSGVMVYNVSQPENPAFVSYFNLRDLVNSGQGDLGPEGLEFISAEDSPTGKPLLLTGNEVSGTMTVLEIGKQAPFSIQPQEDPSVYTLSTSGGVPAMTVNSGVTGLTAFSAAIQTVLGHDGSETIVFKHRRGTEVLGLSAIRGDFDGTGYVPQAQFNVLPGDIIEVYVVDELTNNPAKQPIVLQ